MRHPAWHEGRRNGIKWAVAWLHRRGGQMNDPHAKAILDVAAHDMGIDGKYDIHPLPNVNLKSEEQ